MTDISMQGASLTLTGADGVSSVTFKDLSDDGTPLSFNAVQPIRTSKTLNGKMLAWHGQVTPEFTLSVIPNSSSDNKLRALLLSSIVHPNGTLRELADVMITNAVLRIPGHRNSDGSSSSSQTYTFRSGFLVGGSSAIGTNGEGRMQTTPYTFQFEDVE